MSPALFHEVYVEAIENIFHVDENPWFLGSNVETFLS